MEPGERFMDRTIKRRGNAGSKRLKTNSFPKCKKRKRTKKREKKGGGKTFEYSVSPTNKRE